MATSSRRMANRTDSLANRVNTANRVRCQAVAILVKRVSPGSMARNHHTASHHRHRNMASRLRCRPTASKPIIARSNLVTGVFCGII